MLWIYIYSVRKQLLGQTLELDKTYEEQEWRRNEEKAHYKHNSKTGQYTLEPLLNHLSSVGRLAVDMNGTVMPDDAAKLQKNIKKGIKEMKVTAEIAEATYPAAITTKYKTMVLSTCKNVVSNSSIIAANEKIKAGTLSVKCIGHCPNVQYIDFMSNGTDVLDFYTMLCGNSSNDTHHFEERVLQSVADKLERCPHSLGQFYGTFIGLQTKEAPSESTPGAIKLNDTITFSEPHIENTEGAFKYYRKHPLNTCTDGNKYVPVKGVLGTYLLNPESSSFVPLKDTYTMSSTD